MGRSSQKRHFLDGANPEECRYNNGDWFGVERALEFVMVGSGLPAKSDPIYPR